MNSVSWSNVLILSVLGMSGIAGGAAMTAKLVNADAGMVFLCLGIAWLTVGFVGLILLRNYSRRRAIANLLFMALGINVGGTSMTLGVSLPLFWLHGPSSLTGGILIGYFVIVLFYQAWRAYGNFAACWEKNHERTFATFYNPVSGTIHVEPLMRQLRLNADLFLPERLEFLNGVASLGLIMSMVIGLNLRNVYPEFSAFAWGIPALTLTAVLLQMSFLRVLLSMKIGELEKSAGTKIGPMNDEEILTIKVRKRKTRYQ
jgi:hypothetical protein